MNYYVKGKPLCHYRGFIEMSVVYLKTTYHNIKQ
jgi:hypothetical protein